MATHHVVAGGLRFDLARADVLEVILADSRTGKTLRLVADTPQQVELDLPHREGANRVVLAFDASEMHLSQD